MTAPLHPPTPADPPGRAAPPDHPEARAGAGPAGAAGPATGTGRARRILLGAPQDPRWARPALWAVLALAALLYTWSLSSNGNANSYYAAAVLSATKSWKAFFFGSLDAGSFITVDKPPMALWVMALSGRVFGFSSWSMLLPQAAAGVAAAGVLYATVRGALTGALGAAGAEAAALIAALVLALTPITVAINRDNNPDTLLVLLMVLAAWAMQRAVNGGRLGPLLLSAVFVGMAFNTKMLQAYVVLPALALVYLISGPGAGAVRGTLHRLGRLALAGVALAVSSFWWMLIVDRIPAGSRPYVGGSTDGTVWDLVIGYNGLGRILGRDAPGGAMGAGPGGGAAAAMRGGGGGPNFGGQAGAGRLFNDILGGQISWLIPLALIGLAAGLILLRDRPRTDPARAALLLWGGWLAVHMVVFSFAKGVFHPYYSTALAPAIGALAGAGSVLMYQAYRRSARWAWLLPAAVAATGAWSFTLLRRTPSWQPWLAWAVAAATTTAAALLITARLAPRLPRRVSGRTAARLLAVACGAGLAAGLAGPAAYAVSAAGARTNGTNPLAGPSSGRMGFGGPGGPAGMPGGAMSGRAARNGQGAAVGFPGGLAGAPAGGFPGGGAPGGQTGQAGQGTQPGTTGQSGATRGFGAPGGSFGGPGGADARLVAYLEKNQGGATWLAAVSSAQEASSMILQTGRPVAAMGGFTGSDPAMTTAKLQAYVKSGKLRYVLLGGRGPGGGGPGGPGGGGGSQVTTWVQRNCSQVPTSAYSGSAATAGSLAGSPSSGAVGGQSAQQLYRCG